MYRCSLIVLSTMSSVSLYMYMFLGMLKIIWNGPADRSWSETILHKLHFFYCKLLILKKQYNLKNWKTKESQSTCIKSRKFVSFILKIKKDVFGWFFPHSELFLFVHYNKCACWVGGWGSVLIKILITV